MGASAVGSVIGAIFLISIPHRKRVPVMMVNVCVVAMRDFQFIARAKLLHRDGVTHSEFARVGHELRLGEHDCAGTGARLSARPRLGRVHAEFRWPDAESRGWALPGCLI